MATDEEEKLAWAKLEGAIEDFLQSLDEPGILLDWVMVTHKMEPGSDGIDTVATSYTGAEKQPHYRTLGLLDYAKRVVETEIANEMREED